MNHRLIRILGVAALSLWIPAAGLAANAACRPGLAGPFSYDFGIQLRVGVAVADFNGDGRPDIASLHRFVDVATTGRVASILLNRGNNAFETLTLTVPPYSDYSTIATADVNNDGKADLILGGTSPLTVFLGNGDGTFRPGISVEARNVSAISVGDFNEDGRRDLAVVQLDPPAVTMLLGDGSGNFTVGSSYAIKSGATSVINGDFDADGHADVVYSDGTTVTAFWGKGDGTFTPTLVAPFGATALAAADATGDGRPELFAAFGGTLTVYRYAAPRNFQTDASYNVGRGALSLALADADGDGKPDVFAIGSGVTILKGLGNAKFGTPVTYSGGSNSKGGALGDFDGDGRPDVVVANNDSTDIAVLLNDGSGQLIGMRVLEIGPSSGPAVVTAFDINDDNIADLIVGTQNSSDLWLYLGVGDGTFAAPAGLSVGDGTRAIKLGDVNGDKVPDLVVLASDGKTALVLFGIGGGRFGNRIPVAFANPVCCIDVADLNGDGLADLVFAYEAGGVGTMLSTGNAFGAATIYASPRDATSLVAADFDQDKNVDVAVANTKGTNISVLRGSPSGALTLPFSVAGNNVTAMTSALIGQNMVLITAGKRVEVFWGDSPLRFQRIDSYGTVGTATGVVAADLDGDGKPDLAVTNYEQITGQNFVSWLINPGDGTFNAAPPVPADVLTGAMTAADFDRSGRADVAIGGLGKVMIALSRCEPARAALYVKAVSANASGQTVSLTGTALTNLPNAVVFLFKEGDQIIGSAFADPNTAGMGRTTVNLPNGQHSLTVKIQFTEGATTVSDPVLVTVGAVGKRRAAAH